MKENDSSSSSGSSDDVGLLVVLLSIQRQGMRVDIKEAGGPKHLHHQISCRSLDI